jgi:hypothetical protein
LATANHPLQPAQGTVGFYEIRGGDSMTTNLALNDDLIREAQKLSGHRTKKAVITEALQEYVQRRKQMEIIHIFNQVEYDSDYDYKKQRQTP